MSPRRTAPRVGRTPLRELRNTPPLDGSCTWRRSHGSKALGRRPTGYAGCSLWYAGSGTSPSPSVYSIETHLPEKHQNRDMRKKGLVAMMDRVCLGR